MTIETKPQVYITSDGREFTNVDDAERHESLVIATNEFEAARKNLLHAMAHTKHTADGQLMDPTRWGTYYIVREWAIDPHVAEVSFYYDTQIELDGDRIYLVEPRWSGKDRGPQRYAIDDLYASKKKAECALRVTLEERAAKLQKRIESLPKAG